MAAATSRYVSALRSLTAAREDIADALGFMFKTSREKDGDLGTAARAFVSGQNKLGGMTSVAVAQIEAYCFSALNDYTAAFAPLRTEMKNREKYLLDYDRFRRQLDSLIEKGAKEGKIIKVRESMGKAQTRYDAQNRRVSRDLIRFFDARVTILEPVFQAFAKAEEEYITAFQIEAMRTRSLLPGLASNRSVGLHPTQGSDPDIRPRAASIPVHLDSSLHNMGELSLSGDPSLTLPSSSSLLQLPHSAPTSPTASIPPLVAPPPSTVPPTPDSDSNPLPPPISTAGLLPADMQARRDKARDRIAKLTLSRAEYVINLEIFEPDTDEYEESQFHIERIDVELANARREESAMEDGIRAHLAANIAPTVQPERAPDPNPLPTADLLNQTRVVLIAIHDYSALADDQVSFVTGDSMIVAALLSPQWYQGMVQRTGDFGKIPAHLVTISSNPSTSSS